MNAYVDDERRSDATHIAGVPSGCGGWRASASSLLLGVSPDTPSSLLLASAPRALATPLTRSTGIGSKGISGMF
ncbi:MAG: hypothetical protein ACYTAN_05015 [Planctomycetota bacterium]|jgi:hypothetical protein